ncbi:MAG: site-2 protease family protein [Planctomycetia bacterium]|jgi:membrane-associated protease RseP (regulator of RpoE activity)
MQPFDERFETISPPRRLRPQAILYLATAATTFAAGVAGWQPVVLGIDDNLAAEIAPHWQRGLAYMAAVMAVLSAHEAGHFIAARLHRIPATLPFFIPVPVLLTGTLGAVIGMEGSRANRRQLFDIAIAGPIAGLVVALPVLAAGMLAGTPAAESPFATPPVARWMLGLLRPDIAAGTSIEPNALFMAGWVGLLVTGLNMIPVSQLDGGHVSHAIFGARSNWIARAILLAAIAAIILLGRYNWIAMVVIVALMGTDHPPIRDDGRPLGLARTMLGLFSLLIPIVTFMPEPLLFE